MKDTGPTLAVLGDFGGSPRAAGRRLQRIDRDNFDVVLSAAGVRFEASIPNRLVPRTEPTLHVEIPVGGLAAFEPDELRRAAIELASDPPPGRVGDPRGLRP